MDDQRRQQFLQGLEDQIQRHGWVVQSVFPSEDDSSPGYSYSTGLHAKGLPELIVFALEPRTGGRLINDVAKALLARKASGEPLAGPYESPAWSAKFVIREADKSRAEGFATFARNHSDGAATYLQICFPDMNGNMPWDAAASVSFKEAQPLLYPAGPPKLH